jgi:hypothetical protein
MPTVNNRGRLFWARPSARAQSLPRTQRGEGQLVAAVAATFFHRADAHAVRGVEAPASGTVELPGNPIRVFEGDVAFPSVSSSLTPVFSTPAASRASATRLSSPSSAPPRATWSRPTRGGLKRSPGGVSAAGPRTPKAVPPAAKRKRSGLSSSIGNPRVCRLVVQISRCSFHAPDSCRLRTV